MRATSAARNMRRHLLGGVAASLLAIATACSSDDDGLACPRSVVADAAADVRSDAKSDAGIGRCSVPEDCEESGKPCFEDVGCVDGRCAYRVKGYAEPAGSDPVDGDCHRPMCDGLGAVIDGIYDGDVPDDGNACTLDFCVEGVPHDIHPKKDDGEACTQGGKSGTCQSGVCVTP